MVRIRRFSSVLFSAMRRPEKKGSPPPLSECLRTDVRPCRIRRRDADEKTTPAKNETKASHRLQEERSLRKEASIRSLSRIFRRKRATPPGIRANGHRRILPDEAGRHHAQPARSMSRLLSDMRRSPPPACPPPSVTTRSGPDEPFRRTAHPLPPIVPTAVAQAATFPAAGSITTVPYVRTASHRIRSSANDAP